MAFLNRKMSETSTPEENTGRLLGQKYLLREGDISITREIGFSEEIISFLEGTTWGTEDTLYEQRKRREKLKQLHDPLLAVLRQKDQLLACVIIERRQVYIGEESLDGFFFRYLASKVSFRQRRILGKYARKLMELIVEDVETQAVFYASVEGMNHRSLNFLTKMGYQPQASVGTIGYSRFWPRMDKRFQRLSPDELSDHRRVLKDYYHHHALYHTDHVFQEDNYFVLKENEKIIAGCQAHPATWIVKNIPGRFGGQILKFLPYIPLLKSIFNPNKFAFLTFEGLYVKKGREAELITLFESVLNHFGRRAALVWLDFKDPLFEMLMRRGKHGIMKYFVDRTSIKIMAIPDKLSAENLQEVQQRPIYISTFDFI